MNQLRAGVYKHYKGLLVLVLGAATHSETKEWLVAYVPLGVKHGPRIVVRPYNMFFENVQVRGQEKARFAYLGEAVEPSTAEQYDALSGYTAADRMDD